MPLKLITGGGGSVILDANTTASNYTMYVPAENGTLVTTSSAILGNATALSSGTVPTARLPTIPSAKMPTGSVLQVVSVTDKNQSSYTTVDIGTNSNYGYNEAGFDLTTLDIALTPISTSSKIMIFTNINLGSWDQQYGVMRLKRGIGGATPTWSSSDPWMSSGNGVPGSATQLGSYIVTNRATSWQATHIHFQWLDSPGTTSEVKYRFNFRIEADYVAAIAYLNRAAYNTNDYGSTGAVSSVTLMEIAG